MVSQYIDHGDGVRIWIGTAEEEAAYLELINRPPDTITMRQCRLVLFQRGLLDAINQAVASMGQAAEIEWEYATEVKRGHPLVAGIAAMTGMTTEQMDTMFKEAAVL